MASESSRTPLLDPGEIFRKVIVIRPLTTLKPAMELWITQGVADNGEIALPALIYKGEYPNNITSWRFCRDYGLAWIQACFVMLERTMLVKGVRHG